MRKIILLVLIFLPIVAFAQNNLSQLPKGDTFFPAKVMDILAEKKKDLPDGSQITQQDLSLKALDGEFKGQTIEFNGIGEVSLVANQKYKKGEKVLMVASYDDEGKPLFFVTDRIRTEKLIILGVVFLLVLLLVGGIKGIRAILSLLLTFIVILKYIIPKILSGSSPLTVTLIGSAIILFIIIYLTEGWRLRSHAAVVSIFASLILTIFLAWLFVGLAHLTGASNENVLFLVDIDGASINFQGLLLAGIIIGVLGVLDDVVISQVVTVEQIVHANNKLNSHEVFSRAYKVGVSHIASMTNTLFLAYAGVSLPLLILFVSGESVFSSWTQILNTELIATEIIRVLAGSIGLILSVPIATLIAAKWFTKKNVIEQ